MAEEAAPPPAHPKDSTCPASPPGPQVTCHDAVVDEASAVAGRLQVWVLLRAGHTDAPHLLPCLVQLHVHRVHTRVVGCHSIPHVRGDTVLLGKRTAKVSIASFPLVYRTPEKSQLAQALMVQMGKLRSKILD